MRTDRAVAGESRYGWIVVAAGAQMTIAIVAALPAVRRPRAHILCLLLGVLADRHGAKRVLVAGLLVQALAAGAFVFASRLSKFYAVSFVFGLAYGGVMPLYAVLARGYFGPHIMGAVIGSFAIGLRAAAIALAFPPFSPRPQAA